MMKLEFHPIRAQVVVMTHDGTSAAAFGEATSKGDDAGRGRSTLVNKIVEGLRGDAFLMARDLGLETLTQDGGLERLVERIKSHVFARAQ